MHLGDYYKLIGIRISFKDPPFSLAQDIWDESTTNLLGFKFLCWMEERYASIQQVKTEASIVNMVHLIARGKSLPLG